MADNETLDELALQVPCARCGASPGQGCTTTTGGRPTLYLHSSRSGPIHRAYALGWLDRADTEATQGKGATNARHR